MVKRAICIFLVLSIFVGPVSAWAASLWQRVGDRLSFSGSKTYTLQALSVAGNREMFYDDNYGFSPRYRNETNLTITGSLLTGLSVTATISNNRWNPNDRTAALNYDNQRTKASLGDITASLTGNELASFSKRLRGAAITHNFGFCTVTAIASRTKAATKTVTMTGNNTPGPYYLGVSQIVDGSERVKIDEREIPRSDSSGTPNYVLDTFSGILTFRDGLIVSSTSEIAISFETQSINSTPGSIYGVRSDIPIGKRGGLGLTYLTQASEHSSGEGRQITEPFHGNNDLSFPYELLYVPLSGSVSVKVDGIPQVIDPRYPITFPLQGDCAVNYAQHYIIFNRPIPSSSTILVTYVPKPENAVLGDRSVMGFDAKFMVSDALTLTGLFARSRNYSGGSGGTATALRAAGKYGKLDYTANLRSIGSSFATIESAGFFRSERGGNVDLKYGISDHLTWFTRLDRFRRPCYQNVGQDVNPQQASTATTTQSVHGIEWKSDKLPQVRLSRTRMDSSDGAALRDSLSTDALTINWSARKLSASGEINRSSRSGSYLSNGTPVATSNSVGTSRFSLRYLPGERFSVMADIAGSKIKNSDGSTSNAKNYQLTANFAPASTINLAASYRVSDSGGHYNTPYGGYTGIGSGYNGGQIGSGWGYPTGTYVPSFGLKSIMRTLSATWTPSKRFSYDASYNYSLSEGENNTNTSITGTDLGFTYSPSDILTLRAHSSMQNGSFVGSGGDMSSRIGFLTLTVGPLRKFTLDLNYQKMLSGALLAGLNPDDPSRDTRVNLKSINAILRRDIGGGRYLFTEYLSSNVTGMLANKKSVLALGIEYPLNEILGLKIDWRIIDYTDARNTSSNYHASMLNAQIGARFR